MSSYIKQVKVMIYIICLVLLAGLSTLLIQRALANRRTIQPKPCGCSSDSTPFSRWLK